MNISRSPKSQQTVLWKALLVFKLVSVFLIVADQLSIRWGLDGSQRVVDDLLGGLIAGAIFYLYERHRLRRLSQQLHVIDLMNHHIRNALQPLMFAANEPGGKAHVKLVEDSVRRIEWALREVLPGKSDERFVVHYGETGSRIQSCSQSSSEPAPEPQPGMSFSHWLDSWRERNEKAS